ncbi:hypothetical protein [Parasphingorhabdus sp.]|uniref:hypothetical protein n=1 Tax=Parasphingorhabdus sp. TaxID=2709688 RepID=UPI003D267D6B
MDFDQQPDPFIYADFNALEEYAPDNGLCRIGLTGYGTLASLNKHKIRLFDGLRLRLSDQDELAVVAEVIFDANRIATNCSGWFGKFHRDEIFKIEVRNHVGKSHLCFSCREDIHPYLNQIGRSYSEHCPHCGTAIMFPMLPPEPRQTNI